MVKYASLFHYNIYYDEIAEEFYITSKLDNRPMIGSFKLAASAIDFAEKRVVQTGTRL